MPTREELIEAAEAVVRARGVRGATTRAIAAQADCAEGSIYNHFGGRGDLLAAVVVEGLSRFPAEVRELPGRAGEGAVLPTLTDLVGAAHGFFRQMAVLFGPMMTDPDTAGQVRAALHERGTGPVAGTEALASYLAAEVEAGRLRTSLDPLAIAAALLGAAFQRALAQELLGVTPGIPDDDEFPGRTVRALVGPHTTEES